MGCSSSAPFAADGGVLGEVKSVADDMVESGEQAFHDMGEAAGKAAHEAMDHVKGAMSSAASGLQSAVDHVGSTVSNATHSISEGIKKETAVLTAPATPEPFQSNGKEPDACKLVPLKSMEDESKKVDEMIKDLTGSKESSPTSVETVPPLEKFRPTPVPSFDKPPTPGQTTPMEIMEKPMQKIDEVNTTIDQLTDELLKETEAVATEVTENVTETVKQELPPLKLPPLEPMKSDLVPLPPLETTKTSMDSIMDAAMGELIEDAKTDVNDETMDTVAETVSDTINEAVANETTEDANIASEMDDQYFDDLPPTKWEALADAIVELPPRMSIDLGTGQLYAVIVEEEAPSRSRPRASDAVAAKSAL